MKNVLYTKKGPGRQSNTSFKKRASKIARQSTNHTVGLKNAVVSLVQAHFDEKAKERFLAK